MKSAEKTKRICSVCNAKYQGISAISRTDNATLICQDCGIHQSLESLNVQTEEQEKILEIIHKFSNPTEAGI